VCLRTIGVDSTSAAVAGLYADFLDGWLVSDDDPMPTRPVGAAGGPAVERHRLLMDSPEAAADLAGSSLNLALRLAATGSRP
jgi:LPPG:FO 2-phospho-L-lactate transferase